MGMGNTQKRLLFLKNQLRNSKPALAAAYPKGEWGIRTATLLKYGPRDLSKNFTKFSKMAFSCTCKRVGGAWGQKIDLGLCPKTAMARVMDTSLLKSHASIRVSFLAMGTES